MPSKKKRSSHPPKVSRETRTLAVVAAQPKIPVSSPAPLRYYTLNDLDPSIQQRLYQENEAVKDCIHSINRGKYQPGELPENLKTRCGQLLQECEKTLNLFTTHPVFQNFNPQIYYNTAYYQITYTTKIALLYHFLGQRKQAKNILMNSFMQYKHPTLILCLHTLNRVVLMDDDKVSPAERAGLLLKIIQNNANVLKTPQEGTKGQRNQVEGAFHDLVFLDVESGLENFSEEVFHFYSMPRGSESLEALLISLLESKSQKLKEKGQSFFKRYLRPLFSDPDLPEIDNILKRLDKSLSIKEYDWVASEAFNIVVQKSTLLLNQGLMVTRGDFPQYELVLSFLSKSIESGNIGAKLCLAYLLIITQEKPEQIAQIFKELRVIFPANSKKQDPKYSAHRASFFYLQAQAHDMGSLPSGQNKNEAVAYYRLAVDLKHSLACQNLAIMYQSGSGVTQGLDKAVKLLEEGIRWNEANISELHLELALTYFLQMAIVSAEARGALAAKGIYHIGQLAADTMSARAHLIASMLFLAQDLGVDAVVEPKTQKVVYELSLDELFQKEKSRETLHIEKVKFHLNEAARLGEKSALHIIGCLHHAGNYFTENFAEAERCYLEYLALQGIPLMLPKLYLHQANLAISSEEKHNLLFKALRWHRYLLEQVNDESLQQQLEGLFIKNIQDYYTNQKIQTAVYPRRATLDLNPSVSSSALSFAIREVEAALERQASEGELSAALKKIAFTIKASRNQLHLYPQELRRLELLQQKLTTAFVKLSLKTQLLIIKECSRWPLVQDKEGGVLSMVFLLPVPQLTRSQKMSLGLALAHLKHDSGLFEEGYLHLFPAMTKELCDFENILQAAQFVYTCACFHAQSQHPTFGPKIKKNIGLILPQLVPYLSLHCWEAGSEAMSELYHGIVYLRKAYADQLPNLPDELEKFILFYAEILKSPDATTISRSQQTVFNVLHELNPNFEQEVVEVRSIDFYNRHTTPPLAGFYNGPSHDLYREGKPCALNSATILCQKTLELLGIEVVHISYWNWEAVTSHEARQALLTNTIPRITQYAVPFSDTGSKIDTSKLWSEVAGKKMPINYNPRHFQDANPETLADPAASQDKHCQSQKAAL